jgi:transposase
MKKRFAMYLKKATSKKTGRTYLSIARKYYDPVSKKAKEKSIESLGYLDVLQKDFDDPIAHFEAVVRERNRQEELADAEYIVHERKDATLEAGAILRKCFGYAPILRIYRELGLDMLLANRQRSRKFEYSTGKILELLVISRILDPCSKKRTYEERRQYFDYEKGNDFSLEDVYHALSFLSAAGEAVQKQINSRITKQYGRDFSKVYYDVTDYCFEIDMEDGFRKKGPPKEHRPDPIVQMRLAMDAGGLPISYELFAGNESEKLHLCPMMFKLRNEYESGRVIAVADAAQNTSDNIYYLESGKCSYVFSQTIRGGTDELKDYAVSEDGYEWFGKEYMRKSQIVKRKLQAHMDVKKTTGKSGEKEVIVDQRQIVFYSEKYALRAKMKREAAIKKAYRIIANPAVYTKATSYDALKYVRNIETDKETGELKEAAANPYIDLEKIKEEEKYDGYYCIVTNIFDDDGTDKWNDDKIIDAYRGLWRIEDSFRVTKSELEIRPVYLSRKDRINAHFLICFVALVILRLIRKRLDGKYCTAQIIEAMKNICGSSETENIFLFDYCTETTIDLGKAFDIDFTRKRLTRAEIKNILANRKMP